MRKVKIVGVISIIVAISLITMGVKLADVSVVFGKSFKYKDNNSNINIAMSTSILTDVDLNSRVDNSSLTAVEMEVRPASIYIPPRVEVYDGMTIEELGEKLNRHLGNDYIAGMGNYLAKLCIEKGVDPYIATAIILHETGCGSKCSNLTRYCNNVGGQKGSPGCNGGAFKKFDTLEQGFEGFVNNLSKNYFSQGRTTVETIAPKYCEGNTWAGKINYFVNKIKNN